MPRRPPPVIRRPDTTSFTKGLSAAQLRQLAAAVPCGPEELKPWAGHLADCVRAVKKFGRSAEEEARYRRERKRSPAEALQRIANSLTAAGKLLTASYTRGDDYSATVLEAWSLETDGIAQAGSEDLDDLICIAERWARVYGRAAKMVKETPASKATTLAQAAPQIAALWGEMTGERAPLNAPDRARQKGFYSFARSLFDLAGVTGPAMKTMAAALRKGEESEKLADPRGVVKSRKYLRKRRKMARPTPPLGTVGEVRS